MTQKELLYVEDAIKHENNMIGILNETIGLLEDENLISFIESELKKHCSFVDKLTSFLGGYANE